MSDGPFKTPLSKACWQPVADRAANESFSVDQLREAIPGALAVEAKELPPAFRRAIESMLSATAQATLIDPRQTGEVQAVRREAAACSLANIIIDCLEDALARDLPLDEAIIDATGAALQQSYEENARGIEQHAQLDRLAAPVVQQVRSRLAGAALSGPELAAAARSLWRIGDAPLARKPPKHSALDDGPDLSDDDDE